MGIKTKGSDLYTSAGTIDYIKPYGSLIKETRSAYRYGGTGQPVHIQHKGTKGRKTAPKAKDIRRYFSVQSSRKTAQPASTRQPGCLRTGTETMKDPQTQAGKAGLLKLSITHAETCMAMGVDKGE